MRRLNKRPEAAASARAAPVPDSGRHLRLRYLRLLPPEQAIMTLKALATAVRRKLTRLLATGMPREQLFCRNINEP
ncbi:hypothetical protein MJ571_27335 [Klebsiella pneumoniae]|nr:hypothetical protein MJ571_27335 [Klebsiella pneumoniae]